MMVKASAFHIYEHHDDLDGHDSQCEHCLLAIESQQSEIIDFPLQIKDYDVPMPRREGLTNSIESDIQFDLCKTELLPRPPPLTK